MLIAFVCEPFSVQARLRGRGEVDEARDLMAGVDSWDDDEPISLLTSEGLQAAARAKATHDQLVAEGHGAEEQRGDPLESSSHAPRPDSTHWAPATPTSKTVRSSSPVAPLSRAPEEPVAGSSSASPSAAMHVCPESLQVQLQWGHFLFWACPNTGKQKYDSKTSPIPLPHPDHHCRGYVFNGDSVSARFTSTARGRRGLRIPGTLRGGVNKRFFEGLQSCTKDERGQGAAQD